MSHTIEEIRREYDRLDALCGVDTGQVALRVSTRATKRLGSCKYIGDTVACVTISGFVMDAADDAVFYDTIRHEYAHALVKLRLPRERHGHDEVWKAACREVGCAPERCCDPSLLPAGAGRAEPFRYRLRCLGCYASWDYKRRTKVIRLVESGMSRRCICPRCGEHRFSLESL